MPTENPQSMKNYVQIAMQSQDSKSVHKIRSILSVLRIATIMQTYLDCRD
jgi:hypothetical protein